MQINSLSTVNFKKLGTTQLQFTPGLNFISGENGQGKTTALRAIATALFGPQMLPGTVEDIPTWGQNRWEVELTFEHEGNEYVIKRTKSTATATMRGQLFASGNTPVTKAMEDLFGFQAKDYNLLIHSRQGETNGVLTYGATALQRKVEEFAGAEVVEMVAGRAGDLAKTLRATADSRLDGILDVGPLLEQARNEVAQREEDFRQAEAEAVPEPVKPEITYKESLDRYHAYHRFIRESEEYTQKKAILEAEVADEPGPEPIAPSSRYLKDLQAQLKELKEANTLIERANWKLKEDRDRIQDLAEPDPVPAVETSEELIVESIRTNKDEVKHLKAILKDSKCDACGTELKEVNKEDIEGQIERLNNFRQHLEDQLQEHETAVRAQKKQEKLWEAYRVDQALKKELIGREEQPLHDLQEIEAQITNAKVAFERADDLREKWESHSKSHQKAVRALQGLELPAPVQPYSQEQTGQVEQLWVEYNHNTQAVDRHLSRLSSLRSALEDSRGRVAGYLELEEKASKARATSNLEFEKAELSESLQKFLRDKRTDYLTQVWEAITAYASDFLNTASEGWLSAVKAERGKFFFQEDGAWVSTAEASGAQEAFVGVALRVGINKALYSRGFYLVFDEPTDGMTEDRARSLIASLSGTAGQVFVITHRETDQALANNIVEV